MTISPLYLASCFLFFSPPPLYLCIFSVFVLPSYFRSPFLPLQFSVEKKKQREGRGAGHMTHFSSLRFSLTYISIMSPFSLPLFFPSSCLNPLYFSLLAQVFFLSLSLSTLTLSASVSFRPVTERLTAHFHYPNFTSNISLSFALSVLLNVARFAALTTPLTLSHVLIRSIFRV